MRTLNQWFDDYSVSHQNPTNKTIHYICVPAIYMSVIGLLMSLKFSFFLMPFPFLGSLAFPALFAVLWFYYKISRAMCLKMFVFSMVCVLLNLIIAHFTNLFYWSLIIFAIAWIGQFYGHKIEGKKPSFLKDLQFLMIGPAWVINEVV